MTTRETIASIRKKAKAKAIHDRERMHKGYTRARELGFSPNEAVFMQGWSIKRIEQLAKDSGKKVD